MWTTVNICCFLAPFLLYVQKNTSHISVFLLKKLTKGFSCACFILFYPLRKYVYLLHPCLIYFMEVLRPSRFLVVQKHDRKIKQLIKAIKGSNVTDTCVYEDVGY